MLSVVRAAYIRFTTEDTEDTKRDLEPEVRDGGELRTSVLSVVRAAHIRFTTEDTEGTERDLEPEVRGGRAPSLRALRGPRNVNPFYHGGHRGHGGFSNRRFVAAELRPSVLSVVRAVYSFYHGGLCKPS